MENGTKKSSSSSSCYLMRNVYQEKSRRSLLQNQNINTLKLDLIPGAVHNLVCCLLVTYFLYTILHQGSACVSRQRAWHAHDIRAKFKVMRFSSRRGALFFVISRSLFQHYICIILTECALISEKKLYFIKDFYIKPVAL